MAIYQKTSQDQSGIYSLCNPLQQAATPDHVAVQLAQPLPQDELIGHSQWELSTISKFLASPLIPGNSLFRTGAGEVFCFIISEPEFCKL